MAFASSPRFLRRRHRPRPSCRTRCRNFHNFRYPDATINFSRFLPFLPSFLSVSPSLPLSIFLYFYLSTCPSHELSASFPFFIHDPLSFFLSRFTFFLLLRAIRFPLIAPDGKYFSRGNERGYGNRGACSE